MTALASDPGLLQAELAKLQLGQRRDTSGELDALDASIAVSSSSSTPSAADTPLSAPLSGLSGLFPSGVADSCKTSSSSSTSRTPSLPDTAAVQDTGTDDPASHDPQICFDFTKGMCTRGDKCKYSHDIATIVQFNSKEKGICFDYLRNQCHRGLLCRFSHDLSNIAQQCQQVYNGSAAAPTKNRSGSICYDFVKGVCQRGSECRYSHDLTLIARMARGSGGTEADQTPPHADVCFDYLRGRCTRGEACKYSHNTAMLHGGLGPAPGLSPSSLNPMLLGLNPATSWPLGNPLDPQTAAAAAAAAAAAYAAAGVPGMGLGAAPMGRIGMMGLGADSMTAAYGPMAGMPSPGAGGMAPFGLMAGTPRHASMDGGACGANMADALQAAGAADQLALLMAMQQHNTNNMGNHHNMMGAAANAAAAVACSNALPGFAGNAASFPLSAGLPAQSSALPLGPQHCAVDHMQMLLARPADLNRLLEQSKAGIAMPQQQVCPPNSLRGGALATANSLPNSLPSGNRFSDSGALCPGLPRGPSPKTSFQHSGATQAYNPAATGNGSHLSRFSPDSHSILAAAVAAGADKAAGMGQQQHHLLQSLPLPPGHLPRTNSAPQPMHQQINAAAAAAAAGSLKKQGSGRLAASKGQGWNSIGHNDLPPGLPISRGSAQELIGHGSAAGTPKGADQLAGSVSSDDADALQGNLLPMSIQEIWLR